MVDSDNVVPSIYNNVKRGKVCVEAKAISFGRRLSKSFSISCMRVEARHPKNTSLQGLMKSLNKTEEDIGTKSGWKSSSGLEVHSSNVGANDVFCA